MKHKYPHPSQPFRERAARWDAHLPERAAAEAPLHVIRSWGWEPPGGSHKAVRALRLAQLTWWAAKKEWAPSKATRAAEALLRGGQRSTDRIAQWLYFGPQHQGLVRELALCRLAEMGT